jgi:hypothetical protein
VAVGIVGVDKIEIAESKKTTWFIEIIVCEMHI